MKKGNSSNALSELTKKQQQAIIVCALCALALIATIAIVAVQVSNAGKPDADTDVDVPDTGYTGENYIVDPLSNKAVLTETADAGDEYLEETLFIGDSNTVRFYNNGLLDLQQFVAVEGLTLEKSLTEKFVTFEDDETLYTIAEAVAMMKPRRVVITLGTNNADGSMTETQFIDAYKNLLSAINTSYPYTDIIINSLPPVTATQDKYPDIEQEFIDELNMALADLAEDSGYKFLNSALALKDETGYGDTAFYVTNDIHLKSAGLTAILDYVKTHAYESEDRRPDTDDIAVRVQDHVSDSSVASPVPVTKFRATYNVDTSGGGTLKSGDETGKLNLYFTDLEKDDSVSVTAVPNVDSTGNPQYVFVGWSDGETNPTRTDTSFTQNVDTTAIFSAMKLEINPVSTEAVDGQNYELQAVKTGDKGDVVTVKWYVNDEHVATGEKYIFTIDATKDYKIHATIEYNGTTVMSNGLNLTKSDTFAIVMTDGISSIDGTNVTKAKTGETVTITAAQAPDGKVFEKWEIVKGTVNLASTTSAQTTFTMPEGSVEIKAVYVDSVVEKVTITNVVGKTKDATTTELTGLGLIVKVVEEYSDAITAGYVISSNPAAGTSVEKGSTVTITVSKGKAPPTSADIPNYSGQVGTSAKAALEALGFTSVTIVNETEYNASAAAGIVTSQNVTGNQPFTTAITLTVSIGPAPEPTPDASTETPPAT